MPLFRLAFARSQQPRRPKVTDSRHASNARRTAGRPDRGLLHASAERLQKARSAYPQGAQARVFAFDAAYLLLAAAATGDSLAGLGPRRPELAARGAARLGLPSEHQEVASSLASMYGRPGWESLDLETMLEWAEVVVLCAGRR